MVNYYRDMWKGRSHVLAPLTGLVSKTTKWKWTDVEQRAFEDSKQMVVREALLSYPDITDEFHVYADASEYQLGGAIMHNGRPLAFYTRKLNKAQSKHDRRTGTAFDSRNAKRVPKSIIRSKGSNTY